MAKQQIFSINDAVRWTFAAFGVFVFVYFGNDRKEACDYESSHLMQNSSARVKENFPDVVNALMDKLYQSNGFETFLNQIRNA